MRRLPPHMDKCCSPSHDVNYDFKQMNFFSADVSEME